MPRNKGFISWLIIIVIALAALKYFFNWSIIDAANSEQGKNTINYIKDVLSVAWSYAKPPILYVWHIILGLFSTKQAV